MKTYFDAGVLIAAFRAEDEAEKRAMEPLDKQREFTSGEFVRLELLPKAIYPSFVKLEVLKVFAPFQLQP